MPTEAAGEAAEAEQAAAADLVRVCEHRAEFPDLERARLESRVWGAVMETVVTGRMPDTAEGILASGAQSGTVEGREQVVAQALRQKQGKML
jgi:hypothetical protein